MVLRRLPALALAPLLVGVLRPGPAAAGPVDPPGTTAAPERQLHPIRAQARRAEKRAEHPRSGKRRVPEPPARDPALDTEPRQVVDPASPREQRIAELRRRLDDLLREQPLARTRIGVAVMDATDGDILYAHNADKLFNPASNTKILTTAAALSELGPDYRYLTRLIGPAPDDQGVIHGSVELRGSGDPSLGTQGVADLARDLAARGVTRIEGDLVADGKYRDEGEAQEALGGGALIMNRNVYTVVVRPTEPRHNAEVSIEPSSPEFFGVVSKVTTVPRRKSRVRIDTYREGGRYMVVAKGRVNPADEVHLRERLGDGTTYALTVLARALGDFGIELVGSVKGGTLAEGEGERVTLAEHRSIPLADICRVSNKDSNNFVADAIFRTLGREKFGGAATLEKGARAVGEVLSTLGFSPGTYRIVNGSGLTHENRIQPSALMRLLRHLYFDLAVAPEFVSSLAVGGIDGTIRSRFRAQDMIGRVRAKTGTLSNVSALSGYVGDRGDVLVFTILVDDFHHRRLEDIRDAQVRLVSQMMAYLHRQGSPAGAPPEEGPAAAPATDEDGDDESDHDVGGDPGPEAPAQGN